MISVKQGKQLVLNKYHVRDAGELSHTLLFAGNEAAYRAAWAILDWLHGISAQRMRTLYGNDWGLDGRLPHDIDEATIMTAEQARELLKRLNP